jgi:hypothetical protein
MVIVCTPLFFVVDDGLLVVFTPVLLFLCLEVCFATHNV